MASIVQSGIAAGNAPTLSFTFPAPVTAGNVILVISTFPFAPAGFGAIVSDSLGNAYALAGTRNSGVGSPVLQLISQDKTISAVSGLCTVTVAPISGVFPINAYFVEFSPDVQFTYPGIGVGDREVNNNHLTPGSATVSVTTGGLANLGRTVVNIFVGLALTPGLTWTASAGFDVDQEISNPAGQSFCGGCRFDPDSTSEPWTLTLTTAAGNFLVAYMQAWISELNPPPPVTPTGGVRGTFTGFWNAGQIGGGTN